MVKVEYFSKWKIENRNEDYFGYNQSNFILADWSTDKSWNKYDWKTWGELASKLIVEETLLTNLNWAKLVNFLNKKLNQLYGELGILVNTNDPKYRFSSCFVSVRIVEEKVIITYLWDSGFRINWKEIYKEEKQIDVENSKIRSKYIQETDDINWSRDFIMPLLLKQFDYQNNILDNTFWYWIIDWTKTPSKFIKVFEYDINEIKTIELFTDGYFDIPEEVSIEAWEEIFKKVEKEDPDKWKKYKSTKSKDDRTIAILSFN